VKYILTTPAIRDLVDAADYYDSVSLGGGERFLQRYEKAVRRVLASPQGMPKYYWRTRICQISRSDYAIVYRVIRGAVYVFGIICLVRKPGYWKSRLKDFRPDDF
jgi:hypothetical protein